MIEKIKKFLNRRYSAGTCAAFGQPAGCIILWDSVAIIAAVLFIAWLFN